MQRTRTNNGKYTKKRSDTLIGTIEKTYGINLQVRSDKKLGTHLKDMGYTSLSGLLREIESK